MTAYQLCIANIATFIRSEKNKQAIATGEGMTAFIASEGIALGFCKLKEDVVIDIINYKTKK